MIRIHNLKDVGIPPARHLHLGGISPESVERALWRGQKMSPASEAVHSPSYYRHVAAKGIFSKTDAAMMIIYAHGIMARVLRLHSMQ